MSALSNYNSQTLMGFLDPATLDILNSLQNLFVIISPAGKVKFASLQAVELFDLKSSFPQDCSIDKLFGKQTQFKDWLEDKSESMLTINLTINKKRSNFQIWAVRIKDKNQQPLILLELHCIKSQDMMVQAIQISEARFEKVFTSELIGVTLASFDGGVERASDTFLNIIGYTREDLENNMISWIDITPPEFIHYDYEGVEKLRQFEFCESYEKEYIRKDGSRCQVFISLTLVEGLDDCCACFVIDISQRKQIQRELFDRAYYDQLTKLPNRHYFLQEVEKLKDTQLYKQRRIAVLFIDIDRFKIVNDNMGHTAGDQLLINVAIRLQSLIGSNDFLARLGGDEFVILIKDADQPTTAIEMAKNIQAKMEQITYINHYEIYVSASIGIAYPHEHNEHPKDLIRDADTAMYDAKLSGRGKYSVFNQAMYQKAVDRLRLESDMRHAIVNKEFAIRYEQIVSLRDYKLVGLKALIYWKHPVLGEIAPDVFIPIAKEAGLIYDLDFWLIKNACAQTKIWSAMCGKELHLHTNISGIHLSQNTISEKIKTILDECDFEERRLMLELTEEVFMDDLENRVSIINDIKNLGVGIALDDFGVGFASLIYLYKVNFDVIKFNKKFLNMNQNPDGLYDDINFTAVVKSYISLAHSLNIDVVAESLNSDSQIVSLQQSQCDFVQGDFNKNQPYYDPVFDHLLSSIDISIQ